MNDHNYASCDDPLGGRSEGYSASYVDGKSKALLKSAPTEVARPIREGGGIRNWLWRRQPECTASVEAVVDYLAGNIPFATR